MPKILPPNKVRLKADIAPDVANALVEIAESRNVSPADALAHAISTEHFLYRKRQEGAKLLILERGNLRRLIFPS